MMNLLLDTNILINIIRSNDFSGIINFINPDNALIYTSVVAEAEIKSIAIKNKWGIKRCNFLDYFLDQINIIEINQLSVNIYAEIDSYSQKANPNFSDYSFKTPRNMGKNDLWLASLAALLSLKLVTTDSDFDHLDNVFFELRKIKPNDFNPFF